MGEYFVYLEMQCSKCSAPNQAVTETKRFDSLLVTLKTTPRQYLIKLANNLIVLVIFNQIMIKNMFLLKRSMK